MPRWLERFALRCLFAVARSRNYSLQAMQMLTLKLLAYDGRCGIRLDLGRYMTVVPVIPLLANVPAISRAMTLQFSSIVIYLPLLPRPLSDRSRSKL